MEHVGYDPNVVHFSVHTQAYNHAVGTQKTKTKTIPTAIGDFHKYRVDWTPYAVRGYFDDELVFTFINDGKGNFIRQDLPSELQLAPVMAFAPALAKNQFIGGGNFYGVIPYEGRYDALLPTLFSVDGSLNKHLLPGIDGEIRDMKWINVGNGKKILALARNNQEIVFLKPND